MVRAVHHHHGESGCIGPCDCPNPLEPEPSWAPIVMPVPGPPRGASRPPPTGYRDEHEVFHPGPGARGYEAHASGCPACLLSLNRAIVRGEQWALAVRLKPTIATRARRGRWQWTALGAAVGGVLGLLLPAAVVVPLLVAGVALALRWSTRGEDEPTARMVRR